ncbi:unknown [Methanothermobacter thermautotrophicus str. Delta H]|uniref:Uncharacterized protein n=1 Tax=Methanothermobacter thermautotrophicus (strain ATCC 29096 / DSM 1053 / JCM 10044 / NBRC 100330 / Delta H) TaxID=187420 RepID=O26599_METTH|nr:hypothetical protein [Methanothermobacter thermautotrophicus]AAB85005.1 unknown [Methanothermobacter thermautotrophicus str. Delta H]WBF06770.1 hypothetical protein ISG35_02315 [Methanothermobacter thermautotrophicus]
MEPAYYYHDYPVCPNCKEPVITGAPLLIEDDGTFRCSSCDAFFSPAVHLPENEGVHEFLTKNLKEPPSEELPLIWPIKNNVIEKSYLSWLPNISEGKYLITWPWRNIRFLPVLICECLRVKGDAKIVVIGEINTGESKNELGFPDPFSALGSLQYIEDMSKMDSGDLRNLRRLLKIDRKNVFKKKKKIHYRIKDSKNRHTTEISVYRPEMTIRKCINRILKYYKNLYGMNAVRSITQKDGKGDKRIKKLKDEGIIAISIEEREEWTGKKLNFPVSDLFHVILNYDNLTRFKDHFKYDCITDVRDTDTSDSSVVFISQTLEPEKLFGIVEECNPDIVFFTDSDYFVNERLFNGRRWQKFREFLRSTECTVLMFSLRPDSRHLYRDLQDSFTWHTWDCIPILDILTGDEDHSRPSPFSSSFSEISVPGINAEIEYIHLEEIDRIEEISEKILKIDNGKNVRRYLKYLPQTPLKLRGPHNYSNGGWVIDNILNQILDTPIFDEVKNTFEEVYSISSGPQRNPILNSVKEIIEAELSEDDRKSIFIALRSSRETKSLKKTFEIDEENPDVLDAVDICTWNDLPTHHGEGPSVVIATSYPPIGYSLNDTDIDKFYFIGGSTAIEKIKSVVNNRITEQITKPLHIPSRKERAPELLFEITGKIHVPETVKEDILEFERSIESGSYSKISNSYGKTYKKRARTIRAGTECVLVINEMNCGMFIPSHRLLFFKDETVDRIEHIRAGDKPENLQNRTLLLDEHGFYTSFKVLFTRFMIEIAPNLKIKRSYYTWNGFKELVDDSYEWLRNIRNAMKKLMDARDWNENRAKDYLSEYLVKYDLNARNPEYIRDHWLSDPDIILTSEGHVPVFDVEHPKGISDVEKIYRALDELFPEMCLDDEKARRSYIASRTLQKLRRKFLTDEKQSLHQRYHRFHDELWKEINYVLKRSDKFKIKDARIVKVKIDSPSMKILQDYKRYIT